LKYKAPPFNRPQPLFVTIIDRYALLVLCYFLYVSWPLHLLLTFVSVYVLSCLTVLRLLCKTCSIKEKEKLRERESSSRYNTPSCWKASTAGILNILNLGSDLVYPNNFRIVQIVIKSEKINIQRIDIRWNNDCTFPRFSFQLACLFTRMIFRLALLAST